MFKTEGAGKKIEGEGVKMNSSSQTTRSLPESTASAQAGSSTTIQAQANGHNPLLQV